MGMFGEIAAAGNAKRLEKVLREGLLTNNPDVIAFLKQKLLPIYVDDVAESWGMCDIPKVLVEGFK